MSARVTRGLIRVGEKWSGRLAQWRPSDDPTSSRDLKLRYGLIVALALLTLVLFPPRPGYDVPAVAEGMVSPTDIIAPFDYEVLHSEEDLRRLREQAALTVPPVYRFSTSVGDTAIVRFVEYLDRVDRVIGDDEATMVELETLNRAGGSSLGLRPAELRELTQEETRAALWAFTQDVLVGLYSEQLFLPADELTHLSTSQVAIQRPDGTEQVISRSQIIGLRPGAEIPGLAEQARRLDPDVERLALQLLPGLAPPNLTAITDLTEARREEARSSVSPIKEEILAGELIVGAHTRVTSAQEEEIRALRDELDRRRSGLTAEGARVGLGHFFLDGAILLLFGVALFFFRKDLFDDFRALAVMASIWGLVTGLAAFTDRVEAVPAFAAPVALASVLVAVLWDTRLSGLVTLFLVIYLASQGDLGFPLLWTGLLGGLGGAWSIRRLRRRTSFYETMLFIAAGNVFAVTTIGLMRLWSWFDLGVAVGWAGLSAALAVFLAMGLLPVLEWVSGRTTDLTLLELADLNRPLLKRLLVEAPGTYHHSIVVGNLAEAAVEEIGGNSLLARVGAYYHDIGKLRHPEYFAENQRPGWNPHATMTPAVSARIVSRHVTDGVKMGRAAGLPSCVVDFIQQHHGTTRLTYFWHKAEEQGGVEPVEVGDFVYPGPRPRSKETATVMLADSVEAASRLVPETTPEMFRDLVRKIVDMKLNEHQLDEADLTFHDLAVVEEKFVGVLSGMHHHRVEYPSVSLGAPPQPDDTEDSLSSVG